MTDRPILVTGFERFGGDARNPSQAVVETIRGPGLHGVVLPTAYSAAERALNRCIDELRPEAVLLCGLKASAEALAIERLAANQDDAASADNDGDIRRAQVIDLAGPLTLPASLPLHRVADALTTAGIAFEWSDSAGRFVCNHVYYTALRRGVQCVFLHLPWPSDWEPGGRPGRLTLAQLVTGVGACVAALHGRVRS